MGTFKDTLYFVKCSHIVVTHTDAFLFYLPQKGRNKLSISAQALKLWSVFSENSLTLLAWKSDFHRWTRPRNRLNIKMRLSRGVFKWFRSKISITCFLFSRILRHPLHFNESAQIEVACLKIVSSARKKGCCCASYYDVYEKISSQYGGSVGALYEV